MVGAPRPGGTGCLATALMTDDSGKPFIVIHCVERSISESVAMLPQVVTLLCECDQCVSVTNVPE